MSVWANFAVFVNFLHFTVLLPLWLILVAFLVRFSHFLTISLSDFLPIPIFSLGKFIFDLFWSISFHF